MTLLLLFNLHIILNQFGDFILPDHFLSCEYLKRHFSRIKSELKELVDYIYGKNYPVELQRSS